MTDDEARQHMRHCPDHEMTINADDEWECVTCEEDEDGPREPAGWNSGPMPRSWGGGDVL